jgi:AhpD family alkylhydroperoxidase
MTRIPLREPRGPFLRAAYAESKRQFGKVPDPVAVKGHTPMLLAGYSAFEMATQRSRRVEAHLKELAELKVAALVGCEWCLDIGAMIAARSGIPAEQIRELNRHRESEHFSERERLVLDYAEAMTRTPVEVSDDLVDGLREFLDDAQLVELTSVIALENYRARFNWAMGIGAQGFADGAACPVPALA